MAIPWPLTFFSSTRLLSTAPPSVRSHLLTCHHLPTTSATSLSTSQPSLPNKPHPFISTSTKPHDRRLKITAAHFNISFQPLISPHYHWGIWTSLFTAGAFDLWPERTSVPSSALVSTLVALATTNLSIIASVVPVHSVVLEYLLPITVHLLLFQVDLRRILQSIGTLLLVFLLGSAAELYDFDDEKETLKNILEIGHPRDDTGYENSPQLEYIDLPQYRRATRVFAATITDQQL